MRLTRDPGASPRIFEWGSNLGSVANLLQNTLKIEKTPDFAHFILESGGGGRPTRFSKVQGSEPDLPLRQRHLCLSLGTTCGWKFTLPAPHGCAIAQNHRLIPSISVFAFVFDQAVETVIRSFREFSGITRQKTHAINCLIHKIVAVWMILVRNELI